ncbi:hypothetical protein [Caldithrix abyssi]
MRFKNWSLLGLILIFAGACTIHEPDPPVWDTSWKLELPVKNITMKEIVNDSTLLADTTDGQPIVKFNMEDSTDWEYVEESDLTIRPQDTQFSSQIGAIKLQEKSEVKSTEITLSELLPPEIIANDTIPPYPAVTVTPDPKEVTYDFFERAVIKSGYIYLTFYNDLFIKVDAGMKIEVYNNDSPNPTLVATIEFPDPIEPYAVTQSNIVDLSGLEVSNSFLLKYTIPIAGSDTAQVVTQEQKNGTIYSILTIENIEVSEADAKVPEQTFSNDEQIALPQNEHQIIQAQIKQGLITLNIENGLSLYSHATITLPEIMNNSGPIQIELDLQPFQNSLTQINLAGYEIKNIDQPGSPLDSIHVRLEATVSSRDSIVTIKETDQISINVTFEDIIFENVTGIIQPIVFNIEPQTLNNEDLFDKINGSGLVLDDLVLTLRVENQIDIPLHLVLNLKASNDTESKEMTVDAVIQAASQAPYTEIILDKNYKTPNSIVDLFALLPKEVEISGQATIEGQGTIAIGQGVRTVFSVETPLFFKLLNPIIYQSDLDSIKKNDIDQDVRDRLAEDVHEGTFNLTIKNGTPLAANFILVLTDDSLEVNSTTISDSTRKIVIQADIQRGVIGEDGYVASPTSSEVTIRLTEQQMQLFQKSPIYVKQKATILPTGETKIKLRTSDTIELDAFVQLNFTVRFE